MPCIICSIVCFSEIKLIDISYESVYYKTSVASIDLFGIVLSLLSTAVDYKLYLIFIIGTNHYNLLLLFCESQVVLEQPNRFNSFMNPAGAKGT